MSEHPRSTGERIIRPSSPPTTGSGASARPAQPPRPHPATAHRPAGRASGHPSRTPRRITALAVASALALGGLTPLATPATAAQAADPTDFYSSFESTDAVPHGNTVEQRDGQPWQTNVKGAASGGLMNSIASVTANAENAPNEAAIFAADGDAGSKWLAFTNAGWLAYTLTQSYTAVSYSLTSGGDAPARDPRNWTVQGTNDNGATWTTLDTQTDQKWADAERGVKKSFTITTPAAFTQYRLAITANQSGNIIQLADFLLDSTEGVVPGGSPMTTSVGSGPNSGYNMKARMGFTGTHSLKYAGTHTADGRGYATNTLYDVNIPVTATTRLSYNIFPEFTQNDLTYPSTNTAVNLHFTDGTYLSDLKPRDAYDTLATAAGQGAGKILYTKQWNQVRIDVGAVAAGKTVDRILLSYDNTEATTETAFQGWLDDLKVEATPATIDGSSLTHYVDTRRGTNSSGSFSRGSNEAITAVPNGFNFLVPVTNALATSREYSYQQDNNDKNQTRFQGLGISHEPSPWMGDRNQFSVMPVAGAAAPSGNPSTRAVTFSHDNETAQPDYYGVTLDNGVKAEMTPTNRGLVMQMTFTGDNGNVVLDSPTGDGSFTINKDTGAVTGWIDYGAGFREGQSRMFVSGTFDQKPTATGTAAGGRALTTFAAFDTTTTKTVTLRLATSLISLDQAAKNLSLEVGTKSFATVREAAQAEWNDRLGVIRVEGASETELVTLYSNLYRLNVYPNAQFENTGTAASPVYKYASPVSTPGGTSTATQTGANVVEGKMYVNNGFWDTYRTAWPAYSLLYPEVAAELVDGFVDQYRDGGWIARWSSPGYADIMTGTSSDVAFADAYLRGVDLPDALATYDAALKNATTASSQGKTGRKSINTSTFLGFTPATQGESVSWGLEGYINDYGIGNMAAALADDPKTPDARRAELREQAEYFLDRSTSYVNMFDPAVDFFQSRNADGTYAVAPDDYDPTTWWGPYTETNGWNFAFHAPQDPQGLANLYGGRQGLEDKLDLFFATPETSMGSIHEEVEARDGRYGQWGVSNQVSHHIPFVYNAVGAPAKAQKITREALQRSFTGSEIGQGYPGDEDNGEMSAWYIFNALGLYPMQTGSTDLVIGSPLYTKATVKLGEKTLVINAPNNSTENVYVQSLTVNGVAQTSTSIDSNILSSGATLDFVMGSTPSAWGTGPDDAPASLTTGDEAASPLTDSADPSISTASSRDGENAAALFDNTSNSVVTFSSPTPEVTVSYAGAEQAPTFYTLTSGVTAGADPSAWTLEGSNDGKNWTAVDSREGRTFAHRAETLPFKIAHPGTYQQFRLRVTAGAATVSLAEIELLTHDNHSASDGLVVKGADALTAVTSVEKEFPVGILSGGTGSAASDYSVSVNWGDGTPATPATVGAPKLGNYGITASHSFAQPGNYRAVITATDGTSTTSATASITVDFVAPGGLRAAFDSVCIADDGVGGNCDAKGISFPRTGLADGGLTQGVEHAVPGTALTFTLPVIPAGQPDNATGAGQTIAVDLGAGATALSFIGAATEKNQQEQATVNFTDGTSATTPLQFSDWTKGGNAGATAPYGNIEVVKSSYRLVGGSASATASFFFSTVPFAIPTGKTVQSITMPTQLGAPGTTGRVHVFAIASDGAAAAQTFRVAGGGDITATVDEPATATLATVTVADAALDAPRARVQWGDSSQTEDAVLTPGASGTFTIAGSHTYAAPGTYPVTVTVYNEGATEHVTLTATVEPTDVVYSPTITVDPSDGVRAGGDVTITGEGFAPNESVEVVLATTPQVTASATATAEGAITASLTVPTDAAADRYSVVATGAESLVPASGTVLVVAPPVDPVYNPVVRSDSHGARPGDTVTLSGTGFAPNERVTVELHSTPVTLGTPPADLRGALTYSFTVPTDAEVGSHQIVLSGAVSGTPVTLAFEVLPPAVPGDGSTGGGGPTVGAGTGGIAITGASDGFGMLGLAGLLAALGAAALFASHRRRGVGARGHGLGLGGRRA